MDNFSYETFEDITDKSQLGDLAEPIIKCITNGFGNEMPEDEVDGAFNGQIFIVAETEQGECAGFLTVNRRMSGRYRDVPALEGYDPRTPIYSIGSAVIDEKYQGQGIYKEFNRQVIGTMVQEQVTLLGTYTQNPRVERGVASVLEEFIQAGYIKSYQIERKLLPKFYERRLTRDPLVTEGTAFAELDIDAGDGYHLIFKVDY